MAEPSPLLARPSPSPSLDRDPEKPATVSASADTAQQKYGHLCCAKRGYQLMDDPGAFLINLTTSKATNVGANAVLAYDDFRS